MKSEILARILLFLLLVAVGATAMLAVGPALGLPALAARTAAELHARMPENGGWSIEELHAQTGQPLALRLTSDDVLHSFAIGQDGHPPIDLKPGEWREIRLVFTRPGRYTFYCTRWCGRSHWRMRGAITVTGEALPTADGTGSANGSAAWVVDPPVEPAEKPLYLRLGIDVDAPHMAEDIPAAPPSAKRGAALAPRLPAYALERQTYRTSSPSALRQRLRAEPSLKDLPDAGLWDAVAYLWARQATPETLAEAKQRYATNCAACHGENGSGDGVMVAGLPVFAPGADHGSGRPAGSGAATGAMAESDMGLAAPQDFTDPRVLLGASPALLEGKMLRGGMGTGMPYWGPIFKPDELDAITAYLYTFALSEDAPAPARSPIP